MACDDILDLLCEHLEGALAPAETALVGAHLDGCEACREAREGMRSMVSLLRSVPEEAMPAGLAARIFDTLAALPDRLDAVENLAMMPCEEARDAISAHLDRSLEEREASALDAHLASCEDCRQQSRQLEAVIGLLRAVPREPVPDDLAERVQQALIGMMVETEEGQRGAPRIPCDEAQDYMSDHLDRSLGGWEAIAMNGHLAACQDCRQQIQEMQAVVALLRAVPREELPAQLAGNVSQALAALPETGVPVGTVETGTVRAVNRRANGRARWSNWASGFAGAAAAAFFFACLQGLPVGLPRIETAAVSVQTDVAVNIGFDVDESVDNVTFQINLPEGLKFVDEKSQPMLAQSVSWKGSLKEGKTVVPIVVRGVRPGRYEIEAFVKKGPMMRKTTILLPVQAT